MAGILFAGQCQQAGGLARAFPSKDDGWKAYHGADGAHKGYRLAIDFIIFFAFAKASCGTIGSAMRGAKPSLFQPTDQKNAQREAGREVD